MSRSSPQMKPRIELCSASEGGGSPGLQFWRKSTEEPILVKILVSKVARI